MTAIRGVLDLRFEAMTRTLADIILPAIDPENNLAVEQAGLLLRHLEIIRGQLDYAVRFERVETAADIGLATALLGALPAAPALAAARTGLAAALSLADSADPPRLREKRAAVRAAIETLIAAADDHAGPAERETVSDLVLAHGAAQARRGQVFVAASGFEEDLPATTIAAMLDAAEAILMSASPGRSPPPRGAADLI